MSKPPKGHRDKPGSEPNGKESQEQRRKISGSVNVYGTVETPELIKEYASSNKENSARDEKRLLYEKLTFSFVVIVAILSLIQTYQSKRGADAATNSSKTASDTEKRQLRAYLGVHQISYQGLEDASTLGVGFDFVNYGQTPATIFNFDGIIDLLPYPLPSGYVLSNPPRRPSQDGMIFPKESNPMTGWVWERNGLNLTFQQKPDLLSLSPTKEVYAHGYATYKDVFGDIHTTTFCFFLNPSSIPRNKDGSPRRDKDGKLIFQWTPVAGRNDAN